jgi:anti-anti-sigma factor
MHCQCRRHDEVEMLEYTEENGVTIVYFQHSRILDEATVQSLGSELVEAGARAKNGKLLLNFRNVLLMSSAMIGKLVDLRNRCKKGGIQIAFCEISENVAEVFAIMKMGDLVTIYPLESDALEKMSAL